jgi:hypothetical protein
MNIILTFTSASLNVLLDFLKFLRFFFKYPSGEKRSPYISGCLILGLMVCVSKSFSPYPQHISTMPLSEGIASYQQLVQ